MQQGEFPACMVGLLLIALLAIVGWIGWYSITHEGEAPEPNKQGYRTSVRATPRPIPTAMSYWEKERYKANLAARSRARPHATPKPPSWMAPRPTPDLSKLRTSNRTSYVAPTPTRVPTAPSGYSQGHLDAATICYAFHQLFTEGHYAYNLLFVLYEDEMRRSVNTQEAYDIIGGVLDLSDELENPNRTTESVWRIERRLLALCGFDDERERRWR